jgi:predicted acylesterase/phospholipase RssA
MKALSISGGSTKIPFLAGAAITLMRDHNYNPDIITGISSGALIALPLAMGLYDEVESLVKNYTLDTIWDNKPVNEEGKITLKGKLRAVTGEESLGTQRNIVNTLRTIIPRFMFTEYQNDPTMPIVYIGAVEYKTGKRVYQNLKECTYDDYLLYALASSSIPGFVEGVRDLNFLHEGYLIEGILYDGGTRDHIGSAWIMSKLGKEITHHMSIFSRPKDYNITDLCWEPKNITHPVMRALDIMMTEISKSDEALCDALCEKHGTENKKVYFPHVAESMYEYDKEKLTEWYDIGVVEAEKLYTL